MEIRLASMISGAADAVGTTVINRLSMRTRLFALIRSMLE
jgi:hypothetical protein